MKNIPALICIALCFASCKKEENTAPSNNNTTSTNTATTYSGIFRSLKLSSVQGSTLQPPFNFASAYFSSTPVQYPYSGTYVQVDSVKLNNTLFKFETYDYSDTTYAINFSAQSWQIYGANGIPSFSYTNTFAFPGYTGYAQMPDSINKTTSLTFSLSGVSDYDQISVILTDMSGNTSHNLAKTIVSGAATTVTFSVTELGVLNTTDSGSLFVSLTKKNVQKLSGKDFNFSNETQISKTLVIY